MKKSFVLALIVFLCIPLLISAQIPTNTLVQIVKAEDARRWDSVLENLLNSPDSKIRQRAALAAGRIGDENAIPALAKHLQDDADVQTMVMFALGEIESAKASQAILETLKDTKQSGNVRARAIEAAGKIAAANPKDAQTAELGKVIVGAVQFELSRRSAPNNETILLGITAILRARPEGGEAITSKFLDYPDAGIRADALNTLARLRSKTVNEKARELLAKDTDPVVRANAARILGGAEDKAALDLLLNAATNDTDSRVRVSAIRSLGTLKDTKSVDQLLAHGKTLLDSYTSSKKTYAFPKEKTEILEIASVLSRLLPNTDNAQAVSFLTAFNALDSYQSPETETALARIAPSKFFDLQKNKKGDARYVWQAISAMMAGVGELATASDNDEIKLIKEQAKLNTLNYIKTQLAANLTVERTLLDALSAYAAFKPADLSEVARNVLQHKDVTVRAGTAVILGDQPVATENIDALKAAFIKSLLMDKTENDAQLAILNALYKLDKKESVSTLLMALNAPDYLVRQTAIRLIKAGDFAKDSPGIPSMLANTKTTLQPYAEYTGTKLGQIVNTNADYIRAVSRRNGSVKAVFTTLKGNFTIDFFPEDAPLTVDNFVKLARSNYFNGVSVHRVVANFVMQDGDPRGDGNGSPGYQTRCELNMIPYERGAVGMALSGKDTGGSQWFVTHSPAPHLDGGYTVFGKVNETDMKIVDNIVRGDKIISVKIIEGNAPPKTTRRSVKR